MARPLQGRLSGGVDTQACIGTAACNRQFARLHQALEWSRGARAMPDADTALVQLRIALQVRLFVPSAVGKGSEADIDGYRNEYLAHLRQAINTRLETELTDIQSVTVKSQEPFVTGTGLLVAFVVAVPLAAAAGALFRWLDKNEIEQLRGSLEDTEKEVAALRTDVDALQRGSRAVIRGASEDLSDRYDADIEGEMRVEVTEVAQQPPAQQQGLGGCRPPHRH